MLLGGVAERDESKYTSCQTDIHWQSLVEKINACIATHRTNNNILVTTDHSYFFLKYAYMLPLIMSSIYESISIIIINYVTKHATVASAHRVFLCDV